MKFSAVFLTIIGIQNYEFPSIAEFRTWKEEEESSTHTFYSLHDKPYYFSASELPSGKIVPRMYMNNHPLKNVMQSKLIIIHTPIRAQYAMYYKHALHTTDPKVRYYYVCCRDGFYKPCKQKRQTAQKRPHQKPSRKLGAVCISRMYVTELQSGTVQVMYVSAHSNHETGPTEDAFIPLPASTRETIAMKLSVGIPIERIMEGNLNRCSIVNGVG